MSVHGERAEHVAAKAIGMAVDALTEAEERLADDHAQVLALLAAASSGIELARAALAEVDGARARAEPQIVARDIDPGLRVAVQLSTKRRTAMLSDYRCSVGCFELDPLGRLLLHDGVLDWQENCHEEVRGQERAAAIRLLHPEAFPGWVVEGSRVDSSKAGISSQSRAY